jgi:uncharacterized protein (UPF0335 family)
MSEGHNSIPSPDLLASFVRRIESLNTEITERNSDKAEIYKEAKGEGFDTKILRKVIAIRAKDPATLTEQEAMVDTYLAALSRLEVAL